MMTTISQNTYYDPQGNKMCRACRKVARQRYEAKRKETQHG
jgi:hypothetical protein